MNVHHRYISPGEILSFRPYGHGKKKLVLVHGLASRSETWTDLIPLFPRNQYNLYLLDLLGSGESAKPPGADYSIRAHAERLLDFLQGEGLSGVTLVGHSLGGTVVLLAAIKAMTGREALIKSVVVMGGPGFIQRLPLIARVFQVPVAAAIFVALPSPEAWVKVGLRAAYYDRRLVDREHVARYLPCYRERDAKRALVETCRALVPPDCAEITACYGKLRLPVLLLWGRHDRIVGIEQGERLRQAIPGATLEIIEACGHNPHEEKPLETFRFIDRFLESHQHDQ
ncbi:alpha/beta hydrolase [Geotalea sp. SG265]|uniref:alpha/beta fold hydrolase n=1 Tax=Geotalea sp. SG265 TaxID=2922867 RepID=UPI001FAED6D5|nr:alpha/beta hydrolase [Geotalea sp. SG265]